MRSLRGLHGRSQQHLHDTRTLKQLNYEIRMARSTDADHWPRLPQSMWRECVLVRLALDIRQILSGDGLVALAWVGTEVVRMAKLSIRRDHVEGSHEIPLPYLECWYVDEAH